MRPRISVVMPVYNQAHLISNAIASIVRQTISDWELIIVDDGSVDAWKLKMLVDKFEDERIKLYTQNEHRGMVSTRNFGNSLATADIIALQDADDLSMPDRLEKILEHIGDNDVLYHGLYMNTWSERWNCIDRSYGKALPIDIERLKKEQYIPGVCAFKKELWNRKPFRLETQFSFDWMMHLDWVLSGAKYKCLDIGLYEYVRHTNSASQRFERSGERMQSISAMREIIKNEYES